MKKFLLLFFIILSFSIYAFYKSALYNNDKSIVVPITPIKKNNEIDIPTTPPLKNTQPIEPVATPIPIITPETKPVVVKSNGLYKDGSYTGEPFFAYNNDLQVKTVISGGKISDVLFLDQQFGTSRQINDYARPILKSETIKVQGSNVDVVSGATYSSQAFKKSLASALSQAKK